MIAGQVNSRLEAIISLSLVGDHGSACDLEAVLDTGFNGSLTVPRYVVEALDLAITGQAVAYLADGSRQEYDTCMATIDFDGRRVDVSVDIVDSPPMIGMRLLTGYHIGIDAVVNGKVALTQLLDTSP